MSDGEKQVIQGDKYFITDDDGELVIEHGVGRGIYGDFYNMDYLVYVRELKEAGMKIEIPGFTDRLNRVIEDTGMGVRELERQTGIPDSSICRYKRGANYPDIGNLAILCETLGVSADYLLFGTNRMREPVKREESES